MLPIPNAARSASAVSTTLRIGAVTTALYLASVGSKYYPLTLLLQSIRGYDPVHTGLAFLSWRSW